jgi:hypothetical protein
MEVKRITFSADEDVIEAARSRARSERTTVTAEFRRWLEQYVRRTDRLDVSGGRRFSRDEMNER